MVIDSARPPVRNALAIVHEMNHARYFFHKKAADPSGPDRADYVKKEIQEEVEGVVKSIEAKMELESTPGTPVSVSGISYSLEAEYRAAYNAAIAGGAASARAAGLAAVVDGFTTGKVLTSNTKVPYPDYYGAAWDKRHPKKP